MTEVSAQLRTLKYYTLFGFFVIGVVTVLLGQVLPILSARLALNDAQLGTLFLAQFAGSLVGTLFTIKLAKRHGFVLVIGVGLILMIIGVPGLNFNNFAICWAAIFVYGLGLGITIPGINLLTIDITSASHQASSVNFINFAWGIGAICSQPFVAFVSRGDSLAAVTIIIDIALLALAICFLTVAPPEPVRSTGDDVEEVSTNIWRRPYSWLFILFSFFVIGIESGLGGWLTTYSELITDRRPNISATVVFFSFLVLGRGLASIASRRLPESTLISVCAVTLLIGIFLIVIGDGLAMIGAAVAGLGTSAIFPTNMVRFRKIFGPTATQQATPLFISGICGSASLSWLTGQVSTQYGSLRIGITVLLIGAVLVLAVQTAIVLIHRDTTPLHSEV